MVIVTLETITVGMKEEYPNVIDVAVATYESVNAFGGVPSLSKEEKNK